MAVGFDAQIYYSAPLASSFSTSLLTIGAGSNRALVVTTLHSAAGVTGITLTWNGVPLTLVSSTTVADATEVAYMNIYALVNPAAGNFALAGSWSGANANMVIGAVSYTGVDQTSVAVAFPHGGTASGNSATATISITSATGNAVVASFASAGAGPFTSTSGTNIYIDSVSLTPWIAASRDVGAATVSMTAPLTSSGTWVANGCDILAAATGLAIAPLPSMFKRQMRSARGPSHRVSGRWLVTDLPITLVATGDLTVTEAADVAALAGGPAISAALAVTEALDVAALAGGLVISAALAVTEALDVAALAGGVSVGTITGTLAINETSVGITNNTFPSLSAIATPIGDLFVTGLDTAAFDGFAGVSGPLTVTETKDAASFAGALPAIISGTLAVNEVGISLDDNIFPPNSAANTVIGNLSVVGIDAAVFNGAVGVNGTLDVTESIDTALLNGQVIPIGITGTLTVTEARDTAAFNGVVAGAAGTLAVTEALDIAAFAATTVIPGVLTAIDAPDTATLSGTVGVSGTLGVTEPVDTALITALVEISGTLAVTEAKDAALLAGLLGVGGPLVVTEASDIAAFNGAVTGVVGTLDATEGQDTSTFDGLLELPPEMFGILLAAENLDIANFAAVVAVPPGEDEYPANFAEWQFGRRFDRSLTCRFPWQG